MEASDFLFYLLCNAMEFPVLFISSHARVLFAADSLLSCVKNVKSCAFEDIGIEQSGVL